MGILKITGEVLQGSSGITLGVREAQAEAIWPPLYLAFCPFVLLVVTELPNTILQKSGPPPDGFQC
jgi:hypothetical protein